MSGQLSLVKTLWTLTYQTAVSKKAEARWGKQHSIELLYCGWKRWQWSSCSTLPIRYGWWQSYVLLSKRTYILAAKAFMKWWHLCSSLKYTPVMQVNLICGTLPNIHSGDDGMSEMVSGKIIRSQCSRAPYKAWTKYLYNNGPYHKTWGRNHLYC